jgi:hypothetical protein
MAEKQPPETIRWRGLTLACYGAEPMHWKGRDWWTYTLDGRDDDGSDSRIWEHCPETGETVQTMD